jgi:DNA-binding response OmpR family regulator
MEMARKKIMIVEDNEAILDILTMILYDAGYEVIALKSSPEAEHFHSGDLCLIMLDLRLSGSDKTGAELCELFKSRSNMRDIPVLILSAEQKIAEISTKCGADGFVKKPFDIDHLLAKVEFHLKK